MVTHNKYMIPTATPRQKHVSVKFTREAHDALKLCLAKRDFSIQDAFLAWAEAYVSGDVGTNRIIDNIFKKRIKEIQTNAGIVNAGFIITKVKDKTEDTIDSDTIYNMINTDNDETTSK
jgi:hypothetical protein